VQDRKEGEWKNVGCHDTPDLVAEEFGRTLFEYIAHSKKRKLDSRRIRVLDLFAGDGRLGNIAGKRLKALFERIDVTFLEINGKKAIRVDPAVSDSAVVRRNAFSWNPKERFDVVVSNPPYLMLNTERAEVLKLGWDRVKACLKNLYGLGIERCLELCRDDGVVGVIAPFGWLVGANSGEFREKVSRVCSEVCVKANRHRGLFRDARQDTGIQIFRKRRRGYSGPCKWKFGYDESEMREVDGKTPILNGKENSEGFRVRVGPIVWNREKEWITSKAKGSVLLIYGGNIRDDARLDFEVKKYMHRQYIKSNGLRPSDMLEAPFMLIRRILRGNPGKWKVDSCVVTEDIKCTAENHVIVINLQDLPIPTIQFCNSVVDSIGKHYYFSGSPSVSARVVGRIVTEILVNGSGVGPRQ
jgi:hypothetical protein